MYTLRIIGARRSTLAIHHCDNYTDLQELLSVYAALGYAATALVVEERAEAAAA